MEYIAGQCFSCTEPCSYELIYVGVKDFASSRRHERSQKRDLVDINSGLQETVDDQATLWHP
jgi:hypothetical protein